MDFEDFALPARVAPPRTFEQITNDANKNVCICSLFLS